MTQKSSHRKAKSATLYDMGLEKGAANFTALSPLSFLERAATVYPTRIAVVYGAIRLDYRSFRARCRRLASALAARGIGRGDTVSAILPNIPQMLECHFGVPMTGAVLNAINTRLDSATIRYILAHGESKILVADREFGPVVVSQRPTVDSIVLIRLHGRLCTSVFTSFGLRRSAGFAMRFSRKAARGTRLPAIFVRWRAGPVIGASTVSARRARLCRFSQTSSGLSCRRRGRRSVRGIAIAIGQRIIRTVRFAAGLPLWAR